MGIELRAHLDEFWTVPNLVTVARLPLAIVLVLALDTVWQYPLFVLIVFTDGFDGWLARRLDQETELGAMLDPAFDKITALFLFVFLFPRTELAIEYLVLFFARDAFVISLLVFVPLLAIEGDDVSASRLGKAVTNLQFVTMVAMLVPHVPSTQILMWTLGIISVFAIADYIVLVGREMTTRGFFESRESVVAIYTVTTSLFVVLVWLLLCEELRDTLSLFV